MAERVGSATVEVNADLRKLLDGLDKAKKTTNEFVQAAARQFQIVTTAVRTAGQGMATLAGRSQTATTAMRVFNAATVRTTAAVASATTGMSAYAAATPVVARAISGVSAATAAMTASVASAAAATTAYASKSPAAASALARIGTVVTGITAAVAAAGVGVAAFASRSPIFNKVMAGLGVAAAGVAAGFAAVAARAGPALAAAWKFANHPLGIFTLSALAGSPVLGAGLAIASTRAGPAIGGALMAAGGAAMRHPVAAVAGIVAAATGVVALTRAIGAGFGAMADGFSDARKASADLKAELEALKAAGAKLTEELPAGGIRSARERMLRGVTGGLTSQFATENAGLISSSVVSQSSDALEEFTVRLGSARAASDLLGAALRNPERAMALLSSAGIVFTEQEREMLAATRTLADRLRNAEIVIGAVNKQLGNMDARSGWIQFMYQIGQFLGSAPGAVWEAMVNGLKAMVVEVSRLTGLTALVGTLDDAFKSLAATMRSFNLRIFGGNAREELEAVRARIVEIDRALTEHAQAGAVGRFVGGGVARNLEAERRTLQERELELRSEEGVRIGTERIEVERRQNVQIEERLRLLREELELLEAGNRSQLRAFRLGREMGIPRSDPRVAEAERLERRIEDSRRRIAQAGQLTVYERENIRLEHQLQLFRYGNEEMERRNRLLQIQIAAAQRRQPLDEAQSAALLRQLELQQRIKTITQSLESAFSSTFNSMADALAQFATTGKFKFKEMADSIIQQLIRIALQLAVIKPLMDALSGFINPSIANLVNPGSINTPINIPQAGGFAEGGSFTVPGGRTGDQPYLIGLSAGERVNVTPTGKGFGGGGVVINNVVNSTRDFEVETRERESPDGQRIIDQVFNEVTKRIGRGDMDTTMGARFGMRPRTIQR